uniref:Uncharacterized protein n=1 Tax=Anguilla anguilla TaxID=7936 RepID=A0A0E9XUH0_ANGAN
MQSQNKWFPFFNLFCSNMTVTRLTNKAKQKKCSEYH